MPALSARALLDVWERVVALPHYTRALRLWLSLSNQSEEETVNASVGQCDRGLISIYRSLFGCRVVCRASCPQCAEDHALDLNLGMFDLPFPTQGTQQLRIGKTTLEWRFPRAQTLARLATVRSGTLDVRKALLQDCVMDVRKGKELLAFEQWPNELPSKLASAMAAADPMLDPRVSMTCAACGHAWSICFDIGCFLWSEIDFAARRLMLEVHRLATAYGWSESEILEMTAARRAAYLQMCGT